MFERFTVDARKVVVLAQAEARSLGQSFIGTEHLLLALLRDETTAAARVLLALGVNFEELRVDIEAQMGASNVVPSGGIPFTPRAKKVLELSLREALQLGHDDIGTEHLLHGLLREGEGVAATVLDANGVSLTKVRERVVNLRASEPSERSATVVEPAPVPDGTPLCPRCHGDLAETMRVTLVTHGGHSVLAVWCERCGGTVGVLPG
ncbi:MAG: Clp protease N-terminal domain-containing protein [Acidimicrobiales bacterium]